MNSSDHEWETIHGQDGFGERQRCSRCGIERISDGVLTWLKEGKIVVSQPNWQYVMDDSVIDDGIGCSKRMMRKALK